MKTIYDAVQTIKRRERRELIEVLQIYGKEANNGYEWEFKNQQPIIAAYDYDEPCDVVILSIKIDKNDNLIIIGDEKNNRGNQHEIYTDDIFCGQLDYITSEIENQSKRQESKL